MSRNEAKPELFLLVCGGGARKVETPTSLDVRPPAGSESPSMLSNLSRLQVVPSDLQQHRPWFSIILRSYRQEVQGALAFSSSKSCGGAEGLAVGAWR